MTSLAADVVHDVEALKRLVQRHTVCWESFPLTLTVAGGGLRQVGYEIEMYGTHDHSKVRSRRDVGRAATSIAPCSKSLGGLFPEPRPTRHKVEPDKVALCFSPKRKSRKDVRLTIQLVHREGFDQAIDECEIRCLDEMKQRLKELGALHEQW